jgi:hypothetical protein
MGREVGWWQVARLAGVIQLVECQLPKLDVTGSSPVARSAGSDKDNDFCETPGAQRIGRFALGHTLGHTG